MKILRYFLWNVFIMGTLILGYAFNQMHFAGIAITLYMGYHKLAICMVIENVIPLYLKVVTQETDNGKKY